MTNDKDRELISKITHEVAAELVHPSDDELRLLDVLSSDMVSIDTLAEFLGQGIARYLAERGKEAVAVVDENDEGKWADILPNVDVRVGDQLFLAPQPAIPEGMALVTTNPSSSVLDEIGGTYTDALAKYRKIIAAAGVQP